MFSPQHYLRSANISHALIHRLVLSPSHPPERKEETIVKLDLVETINAVTAAASMDLSQVEMAAETYNNALSSLVQMTERDGDKGGVTVDKKTRREIANSNERRRMQSINTGFLRLKALVPSISKEKVSKVT